jgi:hypothetical protein
MTRLSMALAFGLILLAVSARLPTEETYAAQSRQLPAGTRHAGKAFRFNKVREGIYHAVGTGALAVVGNSSISITRTATRFSTGTSTSSATSSRVRCS